MLFLYYSDQIIFSQDFTRKLAVCFVFKRSIGRQKERKKTTNLNFYRKLIPSPITIYVIVLSHMAYIR